MPIGLLLKKVKNIIVAFDTGDELALITDAETIRQSNVENPTKKCKSIKGAFGGYTAGEKFSANDLIKPYMTRLQDAGFGVWVIAHTKFKTIKEKGGLDEDGYMQLSSNMGADYEAAFGDIFDVTLTGVIDRDLETKQVGDKTKKYATDEIRKLYFRGTTLIDAGGRFADGAVPEFMVFDNMGAEFVRVVEEGMEKSKSTLGKRKSNPVVSTPKPEIQVTPEPEVPKVDYLSDLEDDDLLDETPDSEASTESKYPSDLNGTIRTMYKECKDATLKASVKEVIAEYGKLNDVDEDGLKRIYDMMTE